VHRPTPTIIDNAFCGIKYSRLDDAGEGILAANPDILWVWCSPLFQLGRFAIVNVIAAFVREKPMNGVSLPRSPKLIQDQLFVEFERNCSFGFAINDKGVKDTTDHFDFISLSRLKNYAVSLQILPLH
jgi:hypothetical protein